jgi:hypothetical protein
MAFLGMLTILLNIRQIVDDVHSPGRETQQDEPGDGLGQVMRIEELDIKDEGSKDKNILDPLPGAHCFNQAYKHSHLLRLTDRWNDEAII